MQGPTTANRLMPMAMQSGYAKRSGWDKLAVTGGEGETGENWEIASRKKRKYWSANTR